MIGLVILTTIISVTPLEQKQAAIQQALKSGDTSLALTLASKLTPDERQAITKRLREAKTARKRPSTIIAPVPFRSSTERTYNDAQRERLQTMIAQRDTDRARAEIERKRAEALAEIARQQREAEERRHNEIVQAQRDVANAVRQNTLIRRGF